MAKQHNLGIQKTFETWQSARIAIGKQDDPLSNKKKLSVGPISKIVKHTFFGIVLTLKTN